MGTMTAASSITLGGLLKHLAYVEADRFSGGCRGETGSPVGRGGLQGRPRLGPAFGRRGHTRAALRAPQVAAARDAPGVTRNLRGLLGEPLRWRVRSVDHASGTRVWRSRVQQRQS